MDAAMDFQPNLRLHPFSWLFAVLAFIRQMIIPLLALLLFGARNDGMLWAFLLLIPIVGLALWRQWVFRYGFGPNGLVVHEGLLFRTLRQIDYERIENIDVQRSVLHRLTGVAQLRIETSTGGGPGALFRVLGMDAAENLRQRTFAASARDGDARPARAEPVLLHLSNGELVRYGLIDNRGLVLVAAAFGVLQQAGALRMLQERFEEWLRWVPFAALAEIGPAMQALLGVALLIALVALVRLLSVAFALLNFHDFTLTRSDGDFRVRYGLLTRVALTMRVARIQAVHESESLLHRGFGRVSLRVDLAGGVEQEADSGVSERSHWLAPLCTPQTANDLARQALPDVDLDTAPAWQRLAPRARRRLFKRGAVLWSVALLVPAIWLAGPWGLLAPLVTVPWAGLHAVLFVRYTRWVLTGDAIMYREGWLHRRLIIVPRSRVQAAIVLQTPFDRRYRMATLAVDSAGVRRGQYIRIPYLPEDVAATLARELYHSRLAPITRQRSAPPPGGRLPTTSATTSATT